MAGNGEWLPPGGSRLYRKQSSEKERKKKKETELAPGGWDLTVFFSLLSVQFYLIFFSHVQNKSYQI